MKPGDSGRPAACWAALEDCGDCFEQVLAALQPADVAALRLVSRGWRQHVDLLLHQLQPAAGAQPAAVAATWRHLARLQLAASARSGLPPLDALPGLRCLRSLALHGPPSGLGELNCRSLAPLEAMPGLEGLELSGQLLRHATTLQQLAQLSRLALHGCTLAGWHGSLPALLLPLARLAHLRFYAPRGGGGGGGGPTLAGLSRLTGLTSLELSCEDGASDGTCREASALPRLASLAIERCASLGNAAPSVGDAGLEALAAGLAPRLTSLALTGCRGVSDRGVAALAGLAQLRRLELRLGDPAPHGLAGRVGDEGLRCLADLTLLQSLHLGGACVVGEHACSALGGRLRALTSLQFSDCRSLGDAALYRLAPLAPGLRRLGLNNCEGVTDIALAVLLKGASRLSHLELAGCHRNITGIGLQVGSLRRLRHLNLAGCDAITDVEIEALLPAAQCLEHLNLRDCRVSDRACALLAAYAPSLQWLSLEHCPRVSKQGLACLAAGLPLLRELHLVGTAVPSEAAAQLRATPRGRRLRISTFKHCWWVPPAPLDGEGGQPVAGAGPQ